MSVWKIFYTDGTSLKWSDPGIGEDVTKIPVLKRMGVHSVAQPTDKNRMRNTIHRYHYVYLRSLNQWVGMNIEGVLDYVRTRFDDVACILNGRTQTTEQFFKMRQVVKMDQDIICWLSSEEELAGRDESFREAGSVNRLLILFGLTNEHKYSFRHIHREFGGEVWSDPARHRMYPPSISAPPVYGEQKFWQN